jgi:hypothetical protein
VPRSVVQMAEGLSAVPQGELLPEEVPKEVGLQ